MTGFYRSLFILLSINIICAEYVSAQVIENTASSEPGGLIVSSALNSHEIFFGGEYGQLYRAHLNQQNIEWQRFSRKGIGLITDIDDTFYKNKSDDSGNKDQQFLIVITSHGDIFRVNVNAVDELKWQSLYSQDTEKDRLPFFDIAVLDKQNILAVGAFGRVMHSQDDGKTWKNLTENIDNQDSAHLYKIVRTSGQQLNSTGITAYIIGEFGKVFEVKSADNQLEINSLESNSTSTFFDGHYLSDRWIVFAGVSGALLVLDQATNEMHQSKLCDGRSIYSVRPDDTARNLLLAGEGGTIFRLSLLDEGLDAPPSMTCQFHKLNNEKLSNADIQGEKIFMTTDQGVLIENALPLMQNFSTPIDIQW